MLEKKVESWLGFWICSAKSYIVFLPFTDSSLRQQLWKRSFENQRKALDFGFFWQVQTFNLTNRDHFAHNFAENRLLKQRRIDEKHEKQLFVILGNFG